MELRYRKIVKKRKNIMREYHYFLKKDLSTVLSSCVQGKFFTAKFVKANGEERTMNCRFGVTKYLKGGLDHNDRTKYLTVYDVQKKGYRNIPVQRLIEINCGNLSVRNWGKETQNLIMAVAV